jgi:hypothetical protein
MESKIHAMSHQLSMKFWQASIRLEEGINDTNHLDLRIMGKIISKLILILARVSKGTVYLRTLMLRTRILQMLHKLILKL